MNVWSHRIGPSLARGLCAPVLQGAFASTALSAADALPPLVEPASAERHVGKVVWVDLVTGLYLRPLPAGEKRQPAWPTFFAVADVEAAERTALDIGARVVSEPKSCRTEPLSREAGPDMKRAPRPGGSPRRARMGRRRASGPAESEAAP